MTADDSPLEIWQYRAHGGIAAVAVAADGQTIVAGTLAKTVLCLDQAGTRRWETNVKNQAWRIGLSAAGQTVVVGTGSSRFWDMSGRGLFCLDQDGSQRWHVDLAASVWGLAFSADGRTIAAGTSAKQVLLYDSQGHRLWQQDVPGVGWYAWVWSTALSADGQIVVAGAADKRIRLLDRGGQLRTAYPTRADVFTVTASADGSMVAAGDRAGYIYLIDQNGHLLWEEKISDGIWQVKLSRDGGRLLVGAGEKEAHLRVYDQGSNLLWRRFVGGSVSCLDLSANGQRIATGTYEGDIYLFDGAGHVLHKAQARQKIRDIALSATGEIAVAGSEDGIVHGFHLPPETSQQTGLQTKKSEYLSKLVLILDRHFNREELRTLCLHLAIDYDNLPAEGKANKARELVLYLERHSRIPELVETGKRLRPAISWDEGKAR